MSLFMQMIWGMVICKCYGSETRDINVNKLADEGLRFTNMYAVATPFCYSLLTGEYAWRKKVQMLQLEMQENDS